MNLQFYETRKIVTAISFALIAMVMSSCSMKKSYEFPKSDIKLEPYMDVASPFSEFNDYVSLLGRPCGREANMTDDREYIEDFPFFGLDGDLVISYGTYGDENGSFRFASNLKWESRYGEKIDVDIFKHLAASADNMFGEEKKRVWQDEEDDPSEMWADYRYSYDWNGRHYILKVDLTKSNTLTITWYSKFYAADYENIAAYMLANYAKNELAEDPDNFSIIDVRGNVISEGYDPYKLMVELDEYAIAIRLQYDSDNSDNKTDEVYGVIQNIKYDLGNPNYEDNGIKVIMISEDAEKYFDSSASEPISLEDFGIKYGHLTRLYSDVNASDESGDSNNSFETVIDKGKFIPINSASQVLVDRITESIPDRTIMNQFTDEGQLGFYEEGSDTYSFWVDFRNSGAGKNSTAVPSGIAFVVFDDPTPTPETMAYFVQCFSEDRSYDDVVQFLNQKQSYMAEKEFTVPYCFAMDGVIFELRKVNGTDYYEVFVYDEYIDYSNAEDPLISLYFLYKNSDEYIINKIKTLDTLEARKLLSYYRNHEEDDLSDYLELEKQADSN